MLRATSIGQTFKEGGGASPVSPLHLPDDLPWTPLPDWRGRTPRSDYLSSIQQKSYQRLIDKSFFNNKKNIIILQHVSSSEVCLTWNNTGCRNEGWDDDRPLVANGAKHKLLPQREFYMIHSTLVALFTHRVLDVEGDPRPGRGRFTKIWEIFHIAHPGTWNSESREASSTWQTKTDADAAVSIPRRNTDNWQKLITAACLHHFQF